jgi:hypothetical protein
MFRFRAILVSVALKCITVCFMLSMLNVPNVFRNLCATLCLGGGRPEIQPATLGIAGPRGPLVASASGKGCVGYCCLVDRGRWLFFT